MGERNPVAETGVVGPFGAGLGPDALQAISDATAVRRGSGQGEGGPGEGGPGEGWERRLDGDAVPISRLWCRLYTVLHLRIGV